MTLILLAGLGAWFAFPSGGLDRLGSLRDVRTRTSEQARRFSVGARAAMAAAVAGFTAWLIPGIVGLLMGAAAGVALFLGLARVRRKPDHEAARSELPDALDFLAVCLAAGSTSVAAVETVTAVSPPTTATLLRQVSAHLHVGRTPEEAWGTLRGHPVWGDAARDLARSARSGTGLVDVLQAHAEDARLAMHDRRSKRARTAGVKSVLPLMVCFLPAFILIGVIPIIGALVQQFVR